MPASCIYKGWVSHQRYQPKPHGFKYQVFMMLLDLDELPTLFKVSRFWSYETRNLASFQRADYWGDAKQSLKACIQSLVKEKTNLDITGPIRLLTNMRYFGYCFNPVSFYYCYAEDGKTLKAIVSHITNTPWGEDHAYVHEIDPNTQQDIARFQFSKAFHVSPFMPMEIAYDWTFKQDDQHIVIHMKNYESQQQAGKEMFNASLHLSAEPITKKSLNRVLLHYPLMTLKVISGIYWNALQLKLKGIPFYSHPDKTSP